MDADSIMLYDRNLDSTSQLQSLSELDGPYDAVNRMMGFNIGHLGTSGTSLDSGAWTAQSFGQNSSGVYQRNDANTPSQPTFQGAFNVAQMKDAMQASAAAPTVGSVAAGVNAASLSIEFDAWGNLSDLQQWNTYFTPGSLSFSGANGTVTVQVVNASSTATSDVAYRYDALGRRISETTTAPTASVGSTQLYYDAWGNVIEQQTLGNPSSPGTSDSQFFASTQYVFSPAGGNHLVLRDRNTGSGGNLGVGSSGMGERLYALRDAQGSTTALVGVPSSGNTGYVVERYLYQPSGSVTVLNASGATIGIGSGASLYNWRYLYEGSRDDGGGAYYIRGVEINSLTGLPLKEDPTAYRRTEEVYNLAVIANSPFTQPAWVTWTSRGLAFAGVSLITLGLGGPATLSAAWAANSTAILTTAGFSAAGALIGGSISTYQGNGFASGAGTGFDVGFAVGAFAPLGIQVGGRLVARIAASDAWGVSRAYAAAFAEGWKAAPTSYYAYSLGANVQELFEQFIFARQLASSRLAAGLAERYGPGIGRSGFATSAEFSEAFFVRYQQLIDEGYSVVNGARSAGRLMVPEGISTNTYMGQLTDRYAKERVLDWLESEGIEEGSNQLVQVNRFLTDALGSGEYRIPDIRLPGANLIMDATIGSKSIATQQILDFSSFSGGNNIIVVRPSELGGSFGILVH